MTITLSDKHYNIFMVPGMFLTFFSSFFLLEVAFLLSLAKLCPKFQELPSHSLQLFILSIFINLLSPLKLVISI